VLDGLPNAIFHLLVVGASALMAMALAVVFDPTPCSVTVGREERRVTQARDLFAGIGCDH